MKAYLEGQLCDLEAGVTDTGTFPTMGSGTQPVDAARARAERRVTAVRAQPSTALEVGMFSAGGDEPNA